MVKGGNHFQRTLTMSGYFKQIKLICINEVHKYMLSEESGYQIIYHSFSGLLQQFGYTLVLWGKKLQLILLMFRYFKGD